MNEVSFIQLMNSTKEVNDKLDIIYDAGFDMGDAFITNYAFMMFDEVIHAYFDDEGVETIYWWLYEKKNRPDYIMKIDNKEVPTETLRDIWNIVKHNLK